MVNKEGWVQKCLATLKEYLGAEATLVPARNRNRFDGAEIVVATRPGIRLTAELRPQRRLTGEQVRHIVLDADRQRHRTLLDLIVLVEHVDEHAAEILRKGGVFYVDAQGNAYLRQQDANILIDVRKPKAVPVRKAEPGRLVEPGGLKVLHEVLILPKGDLPTYRAIAARAGVALGTVAVVLRELEALGYIEKTAPEKRRVARREDLLELFVRGYALKLRPACYIGRFRHRGRNAEDLAYGLELAVRTVPHAFTGGIAAGLLTRHLVPDTVELFIARAATDDLVAKQRMLPDEREGNVVLMDYFAPTVLDEGWTHDPGIKLATPLLVYAELLRDGRPREVETAQMILKTYLGPDR